MLYNDRETLFYNTNPIERVWGEAKRYTRAHCNYTFVGLERTVIPTLESVRIDTIRRKCREYMQAYREGKAGGSDVESAVQKYKSHRRVFGIVD